MTGKNKIIIFAGAAILILIFLAVFIAKRPPKGQIKEPVPIEEPEKDKIVPFIPPIPTDTVPAPVDVKKLQPPKKLEIPEPPPKLPEIPEGVPTHIDLESLRAPSTTAPAVNQ